MKKYADKRRGQFENFNQGDTVLIRNDRKGKFDPVYKPNKFTVIDQNGASV